MAEILIEDEPAYPMMEAPSELMPYYGRTSPLELEAAGYIAPFVDEFGDVHSTAYDSRRTDEEAQILAHRFKGQMDYNKLIEGGATPAEALRLTAKDLYFNDIKGQLKTAPRMNQQPFTPSFEDAEGGRIFRRGPQSAQFIPTPRPTIPPEVKAKQDLIKAELFALKRAAAEPGVGKMVDQNRIAELERQFLASAASITPSSAVTGTATPAPMQTIVTEGPEGISMKRGTPGLPQQKASEVVRVTKDGRRAIFDADTKRFIRYAD